MSYTLNIITGQEAVISTKTSENNLPLFPIPDGSTSSTPTGMYLIGSIVDIDFIAISDDNDSNDIVTIVRKIVNGVVTNQVFTRTGILSDIDLQTIVYYGIPYVRLLNPSNRLIKLQMRIKYIGTGTEKYIGV